MKFTLFFTQKVNKFAPFCDFDTSVIQIDVSKKEKIMKKKITTILVTILFVLPMAVLFTACEHEHLYAVKWSESEHWEECSICGEKANIVEHTFDNDCDTTCNGCDYVREITHTYDNACDTTCNVCGEVREVVHNYAEVWSKDNTNHWYECTICGVKKDLHEHVYDNSCDTTCNVCGEVREITHNYESGKCGICGDVQETQGLAYSYNSMTECYTVKGRGSATAKHINIPSTYNDGTNGEHAVSYMEREAFSLTNVESVIIPGSIINITNGVFRGCKNLTSVTLSEGVACINGRSFDGCSSLTSITIPASVSCIEYVFNNCTSLASIEVDKDNPIYHSSGNCLIRTFSKELLLGCKNSVIPNDGSVEKIGDYAFSGCRGLTEITIPEGVTSIGDGVFYNCWKLTSVTIPEGVTSIGNSAFEDCEKLTSVTIPEGVTSIGNSAFEDCEKLTSVTIPEGVTSIGVYAFEYCKKLTSVTIPASVIAIGDRAFSHCGSLEIIEVDADNSVYHSSGNCLIKTADKILVSGCKNSVIPDDGSVRSIGPYAFSGCKGLTEITIPWGVTSIGDYAFSGCTGLISSPFTFYTVTAGDYVYDRLFCDVRTIGVGAFAHCTSLTSITIPDADRIASGAFAYCTSLASVTISERVEIIDAAAFEYCESLASIIIPSSVTSIYYDVFRGCYNLTSIEVDEDNPKYHSSGNCLIETADKTLVSGCKNSVIPDDGSVDTIGSFAFSGRDGLISIIIPTSITSIGKRAFEYCSSLTAIYYCGTEEEWSEIEISSGNNVLNAATKYFYSESEPTEEGNFWHYVDGEPTIWVSSSEDAE